MLKCDRTTTPLRTKFDHNTVRSVGNTLLREHTQRYTLAVRRVTHGDTASDVLAEFLGLVDDFDCTYLDDNSRFDEAAPVHSDGHSCSMECAFSEAGTSNEQAT